MSAIIRTALGDRDIVKIKEIPTLMELLFSLQTQVGKIHPPLASLSLELNRKENI